MIPLAGKELDPYTSPEAFLGAELRLRREARGWSQTKLAAVAHMTGSRIAQIELGSVPATLPNATALDVALETGGLFARLHSFASMSPSSTDRVRPYADLESAATAISSYTSSFIPGLLQTEGYVRALINGSRLQDSDEEVERRIQHRLQRQEILHRAKSPTLWFVLEEELLRRPTCGPEAMAEQLDHLAQLAQSSRAVIQIIRTDVGAHPALGGTLCLLDLPDRPRVAYLEGAFTGQLFMNPERVAKYALAYDHSRIRACSPAESADLIQAAMKEIRR
ncbi:helix-turn-helix domain-containing protein [Streptomyces sp. NPDC087420]|uniref:helix-turn-helix domain-containing protein n=1 Tax=Streptomyces sp. NPDC087420 TaxID=3365785 RepID=UPI00383672CA